MSEQITIKKEALESVINDAIKDMQANPYVDATCSAIANIGELQVQISVTRDEWDVIDGLDKKYSEAKS